METNVGNWLPSQIWQLNLKIRATCHYGCRITSTPHQWITKEELLVAPSAGRCRDTSHLY